MRGGDQLTARLCGKFPKIRKKQRYPFASRRIMLYVTGVARMNAFGSPPATTSER
jgi:hypothetical protein